jgi:O-acetyl-ADP-ribose deacetylase (regulator of RNase III)
MIIKDKRSVFGVYEEENVNVLTNTVNTRGVMGAGIALEFKLRFPQYFSFYKEKCRRNMSPGDILYYESSPSIVSLFIKDDWKAPSRIEWVVESLKKLFILLEEKNIEAIALPLPGTGKGGLRKQDVHDVIKKILDDSYTKVIVCMDEKPSKSEVAMIERLKKSTVEDLLTASIRRKEANLLLDNIERIRRFRDILKIKGIGIRTYQKLFIKLLASESKSGMQENLF